MKFTKTNESIVVIDETTGVPTTIRAGAPNFNLLSQALDQGDFEAAKKHLASPSDSLEAWIKGLFKIENGAITYNGERVPENVVKRMKLMASKGESPEPLMRFWEKLQKNPSMRSVMQLFPFLDHEGIPILTNGNFLAYKGVKSNYTDAHSGKVNNTPGTINEMPRNKISDDPKEACHYGFHVGALGYARSFSQIVIVCEVNPADVVCIPYDEGQQKMRVCKYRVVGNHNGDLLPSTSYELEESETEKASKKMDLAQVVTGEKEEILSPESQEKKEEEETQEEIAKPSLTDFEKKLIKDGNYILAIKEVCLRSPLGLKEAKNLVDAYKQKLAQESTNKPYKELKKPRDNDKKMVLKVPAKFKKIHAMGMKDLLMQPISELRTYASQVLFLVGASKIPGGKLPLCGQIIKLRKNYK